MLPLPWRGVLVAFAFFLLMLAAQVYLSRFGTLLDAHTIFSGVNYTDAHVIITGMLVVAVALLSGRGHSRQQCRHRVAARSAGGRCRSRARAASCGAVDRLVRQQLHRQAEPARSRSGPTSHGISRSTRQAWDLDRFTQQEFPAETTVDAADPANNQATLQEHPALGLARPAGHAAPDPGDSHLLRFPRYRHRPLHLNGELREVMLAARELNVDKLPDSSRNWINEKLIYTHGYGITMNPVNGFTPEGLPRCS